MYSILKLACNIKDRVSTFSSGRNINEINVKTKAIDQTHFKLNLNISRFSNKFSIINNS